MEQLQQRLDETTRTMQAIHEALNPGAMEAEGSVNGGQLQAVETLHPMVESSINAVGTRVEAMVAECAAAAPPKDPKLSEGACHVAHVRVPSQPFGKCHPAAGATAGYGQPHFEVAVGAPSAPKRSKGAIMFDTGAMVTIVTQAWAKAHELKVSPLPSTGNGAIAVAAFNGKPQPMEGTVDMDL